MRRAQRLGRLAAVTQLVFAGVLGGFASLHAEVSLIQRGPVLLAIFGLPGIVGWVGAIRRRPAHDRPRSRRRGAAGAAGRRGLRVLPGPDRRLLPAGRAGPDALEGL